MAEQQATQQFLVEVNGAALPDEVASALVTATVEDNLQVPDAFELSFRDPDRQLISTAGLSLGSSVTVSVQQAGDSAKVRLLTGEITAMAVAADDAGTRTVVSGYDQSHRLFRGRRSETYTDVSYADVARTVAERAGLKPGRIDSTRPVHERVAQENTTDWQFLRRLARDVDFEVAVVDGKLDFRKPTDATAAPEPGTIASTDDLQLRLGSDLRRVTARVSAAEQVSEVEVRGWDPVTKRPLVAVAAAQTTSAVNGAAPGDVANRFGGQKLVLTESSYRSQTEVESAARAAAEQVGGACTELSGVARGNPRLRAGAAISIGLAGEPFDGRYTLGQTQHRYDPREGYTVAFTASGRQDRSLLALTGGSAGGSVGGSAGGPDATHRVAGVVPATVTDVADPEDLGRVKVSFPWMSDAYTSDWMRMLSPGAGAGRGTVVLPEVGDEVLVAFESGDMRHGYVLGGLFNGVDPPPTGDQLVDGTTGTVRRRGFISRRGHKLIFFDDDADSGVALLAEDDALRISLNGSRRRIRITADGTVEISGEEVIIKSNGDTSIEAAGRLRLRGTTVQVQGSGPVEVTGSQIKLN